MPTPLPTTDTVDLEPPTLEEVQHISRGLLSGAAGPDGVTKLQCTVLHALTRAMTGHTIDFSALEPISAADFAAGLARRNLEFRTRMVQYMELSHMVRGEASVDVAEQVIEFARELSVESECVHRAREVADGSRAFVAADIDRSSYVTGLDLSGFSPLRTADDNVYAWTNTVIRDELAEKWRSLGALSVGTLGRGVHDFYVARGFKFPGEEGSAPPLLAQHDWVHILADFGSKVESELEVFAFIARASDDPEAFTLLAMVVNLFQTGALAGAAGLFEADPGHLDADGMPERFADAFRRGAMCHGSTDFLAVDFWSLADQEVEDVRRHFGIVPKSDAALGGGSVGPWEPGGMSPFQVDAGRRMAEQAGRTYDSFGASA